MGEMSADVSLNYSVMLVLTVGASLAGIGRVAFVMAVTSRLGPAYGVVARDAGISMLHLKGQGPLLRWGGVRLFEASHMSRQQRFYTLYGARASVYWLDFEKPRKRVRLELIREDFTLRQQNLLALIAACTGLQPRTFSTALMSDDVAPAMPTRRSRALAYSIGYGLAGLLVLLAAAVLALPLTHNPLLDGYAAGTSVMTGIALMAITRQALKTGPALPAQCVLPGVPPLTGDPLEVTYRRRFLGWLQDLAIGLVLLPDVITVVAALTRRTSSPPLTFATHVVAYALALVALIGFFAILNACISGRTTLAASTDGLSERRRRKTKHLPWNAIVRLKLKLEKGAASSFTALGRDGATIQWPARDVVWQAARPSQPVTVQADRKMSG
jgi:hypothetical protein